MRRNEDPINRDQIVRAALAIVDSGGSGALSMRAVASKVDRHVSSLYNHVTNRAELVELLSAHIVRDIDVSGFASLPWDEAVIQWSRSYVAAFVAHPNMVQILATSPVRDVPTLAMYETILQALVRHGWLLRDAVHVIRAVEAHAWGTVFDIVAPEHEVARYEDNPNLVMVRATLASVATTEHGAMTAFEAGLGALVAGLRLRHAATFASSEPQWQV